MEKMSDEEGMKEALITDAYFLSRKRGGF